MSLRTPSLVLRPLTWLSGHPDGAALAIVACGFLVYLHYSSGYYLNPDEASLIYSASQANPWRAYLASHSHPHPPLMVLVLHLALRLGKSVVMLRLLSGASCAAAAWLTYRWARRTHGQPEALAGLVLVTFSPAMVSAACEVRQYALLLLFTCGALILLQRFLEGKSLWVGGAYSACLYGAVLTHYSAAWIAVTFAIYGTVALLAVNPGRRVRAFWCLSLAGVAVLYLFLYFTHVHRVLASGYARSQMLGYLHGQYFSPADQALVAFAGGQTVEFFAYLMGGQRAGVIALACFVAALIHVLVDRTTDVRQPHRRYGLILLAMPLGLGCLGAIAQALPFGGSRHSSYLLPFASTGIALGLVRVFRPRSVSRILVAAMVLVPLWLTSWRPPNAATAMAETHLQAALGQLRERVPAGAVLLVDDMTHYVLAHYLGRGEERPRTTGRGAYSEFTMGPYRVVWPRTFAFAPDNFADEVSAWSRAACGSFGDSVWVMTTGWGPAHGFGAFVAGLPEGDVSERWYSGPITLLQVALPPGRSD